MRVTESRCLDVFFGATSRMPRWAVASEHQQVQVWPLVGRTETSATKKKISITLETQPLLTLPSNLASLGWKCLVKFCPFRPDVVACCGLTRQRKLILFDYMRYAPIAVIPLDEWPTSLATCAAAPLLAVGGASGGAKFVEYLAESETEEEQRLELSEIATSASLAAVMLRSAADAELHCNNIRSLAFAGATLFSAAEDEVASWALPLVAE